MWMNPSELIDAHDIWVICGNYGSGKTELAVNLALRAAREEKTALVDLDIVNPYFRSAERKALLEGAGARVLMPTFALTTVDIPALPADITSVFGTGERVIIDCGGDDTGATALGRYKPLLDAADARMLFVVNARRPLTGDAESILVLMERIRARSRMEVAALCNNTNLGAETTAQDVLFGAEITREVATRCGCKAAFHCAAPHIIERLPADMRPHTFPLTPYMRPEWL